MNRLARLGPSIFYPLSSCCKPTLRVCSCSCSCPHLTAGPSSTNTVSNGVTTPHKCIHLVHRSSFDISAPPLDHIPHQVTCVAQAALGTQQRHDPALVAEAQLCCSSAAAALHLLLQSNHHHSGASFAPRADLCNIASACHPFTCTV